MFRPHPISPAGTADSLRQDRSAAHENKSAIFRTLALLLALGWLGAAPVTTSAAPGKEKKSSAQTESPTPGIIKTEANIVLVNVVVTDRRRHYLRDLNQQDFHVFEDGVEQPIASLSRAVDIQPSAPEHERYIVIFFDNSEMNAASQVKDRADVEKILEGTASPNRMTAIMDFNGSLHIDQSFTANGNLLKSAASKIQFGAIGTQARQQEYNIVVSNLLQAIRDVANMLGPAPGHKTLIFVSAGFSLDVRQESEFQDTIDALNKANVGLYPVNSVNIAPSVASMADSSGTGRQGGARSGAGRGAGRREAMPSGPNTNNPVLNTLASRTGAFPSLNMNSLLEGMKAAFAEMDESYILGYVPPSPVHDGRYHRIQVKVNRSGAEVRARNGYFDTKGQDILAGKPEGNVLEAQAASSDAGQIPVALRAPYFYVQPDVARVSLALSFPASALVFEKKGDIVHSQVDVLGIAYRGDGSIAARFSDTINLDYGREEMPEVTKTSINYQNSFKIAPGQYTFKLVLNPGGGKFGKSVMPLGVSPLSGKQLMLSGPAFGDRVVAASPGLAENRPGTRRGKRTHGCQRDEGRSLQQQSF